MTLILKAQHRRRVKNLLRRADKNILKTPEELMYSVCDMTTKLSFKKVCHVHASYRLRKRQHTTFQYTFSTIFSFKKEKEPAHHSPNPKKKNPFS